MIRDASQTVDEEEPDYYDPNSDLTQAPDTSESGTTGNISWTKVMLTKFLSFVEEKYRRRSQWRFYFT